MQCKINNNSSFDISEIEELIQDLFSFSQNRFGFKKPPVLNLVSDDQNTSPLGKTAHYDPSTMEIVIYVDNRHPKDIMRSFSHELVHHNQNENGMFDKDYGCGGDGYAQSNPYLRKMEKEAYLKGNMCFRDWEDGYKSSNPNILNERRIYKMSTKDWKNKELGSLLNEKWGFSMDLGKLNEASCGSGSRDDEKKKLEEEELEVEDGPGEGDDNMGITKSGKMVPNPGGDGKNKSKKEKDDKKDKKTKKPEKGKVPEQFKKNKKDKEKIEEISMGNQVGGKTADPKDVKRLKDMTKDDPYTSFTADKLDNRKQVLLAIRKKIKAMTGKNLDDDQVKNFVRDIQMIMAQDATMKQAVRKDMKEQIRRILKNKMKRNK